MPFTGLGKIISDHEAAANAVAARGSVTGPSQSRYDAWYEQYLKSIEQYKGTSFYNELLNNPYASRQDAPLNFFQQLWKGFTGTSAAETNFYNQREQSAAEYMSQILDAHRQQEYNDPAAQMARQKAAGLNPELNGGQNISSGETPGATPDDTPPVVEAVDDLAAGSQVMSIGMSIFQNVFSAVGAIQQIHGQSLANSEREISLTNSGWDSLIKLAAESGDWSVPTGKKSLADLNDDELDLIIERNMSNFGSNLESGTFSNMYDRKTTRNLMKRLEGVLSQSGSNNLAYRNFRAKLLKEVAGNTESAAETVSKYGFNDSILDYGRTLAQTFMDIEKEARKAVSSLKISSAESAAAEADYASGYYSEELGQEMANADLETAKLQAVQARLDSVIDKALDGLINDLMKKSDIGSLMLVYSIAASRSAVKTAAGSILGKAGKLL